MNAAIAPLPDTPLRPRVIAIAAGSTGGHRHIGQAIGEAYQKAFPRGHVVYISSTEDSMLKLGVVPGWRYERIASAPFTGQSAGGKLRALVTLAGGLANARRLLRAHGVDLVVGCGSFASVAVVLAARSLGLPTVIHEANRVPGRANRLVMGRVDRILTGFEPDRSVWAPPHHVLVGNPVRKALADTALKYRTSPQARDAVLVLGGSQGSPFLNGNAPELMAALARQERPRPVWHQAGEHPVKPIQQAYARLGVEALVQPFFDDLAQRYAAARLAVATAGAVTLEELAAFGLPALLVPLRNAADDHQTFNARYFARMTGTPWCPESAWEIDPLARRLDALLRDDRQWQQVSGALRGYWRPDAARRVIDACLDLGPHHAGRRTR